MKQLIFLHGFIIMFVLTGNMAFSQSEKPVRLEIPVRDDTEIYKVVTCDENGIMIIYLSSETNDSGDMLWTTAFLDRELKELWRKSIGIPRGFVLSEALYSNNHLIGFWFSTRSSEKENLKIIDFRIKDSTYTETKLTIPEKSELTHFGISNGYALIGLNSRDEKALFIRYDFLTSAISRFDQQIESDNVIESMNIDRESGSASIVLRTTGSARKRAYYLIKIDKNGIKTNELMLSKFNDNNMINTAFAYRIDNESDLIVGSYGKSSRTRVFNGQESIGVASTGFFTILVQNNIEVKNTFYEFSDLQNFYRYLRKPSDLNVRRGTLRAERGAKESSIDHDLLAHDVFKWKDNYVFLAEAYYPEYRTVTTMVYDYYGRPYPSTYSVFEGFRYLTTFVAGFDSTGVMKWNNDLELRNIISQSLKQKVLAWEDPDGLVLSYTEDAKIGYKILSEGNSVSNISFTEIASLSPRDKVYKDSNSNMVAWYGNYFLVFGYQNIKNNYQSDRSNKNVFYMNKIAFR